MRCLFILTFLLISFLNFATDYHVGPSQSLSAISDVPWDNLQAGDNVYIHWKSNPYYEKWVINAQGTAQNPISIIGVSGPQGQQPVISGENASTAAGLNFWNDSRGVIKVGGSSIPSDGMPQHILIENLEIRSARPPFQFRDDTGRQETYSNNAASIYVEKAQHLTIKNCTLHDSGNGLFVGAFDGDTQDIMIDGNYIYDNGIEGRFYEHNTYTAAIGIIYQNNRFGPLRSGADGNNLKDRSAGLVVRYNWIEGGNRQLDLVDAEDSENLVNHPDYNSTFVYGNVLIEPDGDGNSQIIHYGGDSGTEADYRKGNLYVYNNTIISYRQGNTTLVRLSTNDETAHVNNNVIYTTDSGDKLAMSNEEGSVLLNHNWIKQGWKESHGTLTGQVVDNGNNIVGSDPGFLDLWNQDLTPIAGSDLIGNGQALNTAPWLSYPVDSEYAKHQNSQPRNGQEDIGAFEHQEVTGVASLDNETEILLYPNPADDELRILTRNGKVKSVRVYAVSLQLLKVGQEETINVQSLESGMYCVKVMLESGEEEIHPFMKR